MGTPPKDDDDDELAAALAAAEEAEASEPASSEPERPSTPLAASTKDSPAAKATDATDATDAMELGWLGLRWKGLKQHFTHKPDPLTSLVFVLPVFLAYSLSVLALDRRVGVDFLSRLVLEQLLRNTAAYVAVHLGVAVVLGGLVWILRRKGKIEPAKFLPMIVESVLWALLISALVHIALARLLPAVATPAVAHDAPRVPAVAVETPGAFARCVLALGAGFYEEVVFRAAVVGTFMWALPKYLTVSVRLSTVIALAVSTVLFVVYAWVVGTDVDHTLRAVLGNVVLGVALGVAYRFRGFAVAVYTHALFGLVSVAVWALG